MNHAFFKALLFLSAGSVIHAILSLIGFPFLTGFYSKDVILELAYTKYTISGNFAFCGCCSPDTIVRGHNSANTIIRGEQELGIGCGRNSRQWLRCSVDSLPLCGGPNPYDTDHTEGQALKRRTGTSGINVFQFLALHRPSNGPWTKRPLPERTMSRGPPPPTRYILRLWAAITIQEDTRNWKDKQTNPPGGLPSYKSHDTGAGFSKKPRSRGILQPWEPGLRHPSFAVDVSAKFVCRQLNVSISIHGRICKRFPVARRHPSPGIDLYHFRRNDIKVLTFSLVSRSGVPSSLALRPRNSCSSYSANSGSFEEDLDLKREINILLDPLNDPIGLQDLLRLELKIRLLRMAPLPLAFPKVKEVLLVRLKSVGYSNSLTSVASPRVAKEAAASISDLRYAISFSCLKLLSTPLP
ncbi:unnamed protein product [Dovyalis caffra]|uniref:Uncharacterized protein n=1 Tax=Dovyalis caffra TaxID=77055 RepID=A0AAV1QWW9_9ROSI|nr:unnamed protein product [Dovyalis caffra]